MEKIATENLFLLEFLVDSVALDKKCECDAPPGETCVSFQFLDNVPLDVCEADFEPKRNLKSGDNEAIKSGKSCLFSLSPQQATEALEQFDIAVSVMKKMQPGWLPETVQIGSSIIGISNLFSELISSVELSDGTTPTAKTLKDVFDVSDSKGISIGKINVYIRISCFGKLIVTQFQMNLDDKSVLFKDKEGKSLYRYKKAGKKMQKSGGGGRNSDFPKTPRPDARMPSAGSNFNQSCPQVPCDHSARPQTSPTPKPISGGYECPLAPCGPEQQMPYGPEQQMPSGPQQQMPYGPQQQMSYGPEQQMSLAGSPYQQQQFLGSPQALALQPFPGYPQQGGLATQTMLTPCNECGFLPNAACLPPMGAMVNYSDPVGTTGPPGIPEGNYQEIGASMGGNSLTIRVHKDQGKAEQFDPNTGELCICGPEGTEGGAGKNQAFSLRPAGAPDTPFSFKIGDHQQPGPMMRNTGGGVVVNPPVYTAPDGTQITEFSDPNKETFILRIGKKSEGVDKKNNLELELQTPKGPPLKPIPKKETRETQYDTVDAGLQSEAPAKAAKPKGDKKGKGKKGKK
ncbi:unnamed protein product [Ceutorhynchus assimilis]|uniref:Uncharacterized protein n=1 Tax=Ceutorhynchus assimilis TaxID=467358 RepID=A0A9N9MEL3_9CUCU|nr:unnamed protein product [Ceutorhynchus assimilis]